MQNLKQYYRHIDLDDGMVRLYTHPHVTDVKHLESACSTVATAAHYFVSRYLDIPFDGLKTLTEIMKLQDTDENSHTYGNFRWFREEHRIQDTNAAFFTMKQITMALRLCPEKIPEAEKALIMPALDRVLVWFRKECSDYGYYYPNKIASDGSLLMLIASVRNDPTVLEEAYDFWNKWLDYTDEYGWGWGENTSKCYSAVLNDAFETALMCMDPQCQTYQRLLKARKTLLDFMAYHGSIEVCPSIRTYNHTGKVRNTSGVDILTGANALDLNAMTDENGTLGAGTIAELILHSIAPVYTPDPDPADFHREHIFGKSTASTFKGKNIRLGTVSQFPVMCGCDQNIDPIIGPWGLSWQSMPVSAVAVNHETSFLRYVTESGGERHTHMAIGLCDKTLFPDENIVDTYTFSAQERNCAVVARMVEHIANASSYFADEWYFQHFDGQIRTVGDWFVFDYGDCALCLRSFTGKLEVLQEGENVRLVNKLYEGPEKLLICRRFISAWGVVALDSCEDIEGQLAKIHASASKIKDLRYARENPCLRLCCGEATMDFDPDKTDLI